MKKEMLINVLQPEECRIAIIEDGRLEELYVERTSLESYTGNIYMGRVVNLEPAIQAAFVDFSVGRNGFLHVSDVEPRYFERASGSRPREREREGEPRRESRRDRPRDSRRKAAPIDPLDPDILLPPADFEDRGPERERRRERPDLSIKGRSDRRDRGNRWFGEGLVDPPPEPQTRPSRPAYEPFEEETAEAAQPEASAAGPEMWDRPAAAHPEPPRELPPAQVEMSQGRASFEELFDPDLPPSRTHRGRGYAAAEPDFPEVSPTEPAQAAEPDEPPGDEDFEIRSFHPRERRSARRRGRSGAPRPSFSPPPREPEDREIPAPHEPLREPIHPELAARQEPADFDDELRYPIEPPRRTGGGRAAIRSRGGEAEPRGREPALREESWREERPGRTSPAYHEPGPESRRGGERRTRDLERGRGPDAPELPGERGTMHDRAGEPGYIPRRERLRSSEALGGLPADPEISWERETPLPAEPFASEEPAESARTGSRRRRRRGRRRDQEPIAPDSSETRDPLHTDRPPRSRPTRSRSLDDEPIDDDLPERDLDEPEADADVDPYEPAPSRPEDEEIDFELEQEIRREIEEIAELEREVGMRGPDGKTDRDDASRGRPGRGRGPAKPPIQEIFRRGDEVLVQVIKESIGAKGPTLSTYISIPGRYLVLMPGLSRVGVSRKIVDEEKRRKLREIMLELNPPKGLGFIVRTAGLERSKRELARDLAYLLRLWKVILRRIKKSRSPAPIYQESDMIIRTIRDIFNSEIDTIWIDEPNAFERAHEFLKVVMPRYANRIKLYEEKVPLFHKYGIEDEIAKIQRRHVPLKDGGSIVIDQTEALVAIDVNSGNFRVEDDAERTAYEMNLRAAREIARQLRLRDLGGVIVNDFIDMREERHRRGVERALREAVKRDRARTKILRMSAFGLIEMTRQRIRPSLKRSVYEDCPHCGGSGVAKTPESMAIDVMRLLALATHREEIRRVTVTVSPAVASYLSNKKRVELARLETEGQLSIQILFKEDANAEHLQIVCHDANGNEVRAFPQPQPQQHPRRIR